MQVELNNATRKLCVIGDPVLHSKSPLLHNTMIAALGLDYIYLCQPVKPKETAAWLSCAKLAGYAGFNATMPHKEALVPLMDELDEDARWYGSVNTVCIKEGKVYGYNTDGRGFLAALQARGIEPAGRDVVLLGAGGAAKAVALKLVQAGVRSLTVCNRTVERAELLCKHAPGVMTSCGFAPEELARAARGADLLVNGTSLGMEGTGTRFADLSFVDALPAGAAVCDLIYHPARTALLARAEDRGLTAMNGLGMLIYQAIFALEHFTGVSIDAHAMARRLEGLL